MVRPVGKIGRAANSGAAYLGVGQGGKSGEVGCTGLGQARAGQDGGYNTLGPDQRIGVVLLNRPERHDPRDIRKIRG